MRGNIQYLINEGGMVKVYFINMLAMRFRGFTIWCIALIILLLLPTLAQAEYLGCFEPSETVYATVQFNGVTGEVAATSVSARVLDPNDTTIPTKTLCASGCDGTIPEIDGTNATGLFRGSFSVGATPLAGTWTIRYKGTVDGNVQAGSDTFHVVDTAGDCASRTGVVTASGTVTTVTNGVTLASSQGAVTFTGNVAITDGLTITRSTANQPAISATGNGTGAGVYAAGGIYGDGLYTIGGVAGGAGFQTKGQGSGNVSSGVIAWGDGGPGILAKSTSGIDGIQAATLTGSITGNLSGSVNSVTTGVTLTNDAITAAKIADDAGNEIAGQVWGEDATANQTQGTFGQAIGDPVADADTIWGLANTNLPDILTDTADMQPKLGTPVASVSGDIATVLARTNVLKQITVSAGTTASAIISTGSFTESSNKGYVGGVVNCPNATAPENRPVFLKIISFDPTTDKVTLNGSFPTVLTTGDVCNIYIDTIR